MEYQNYLIVFKQIDSNLFVKITNKKSNESFENLITPDQIDNLPINKFIKILENSIKFIPDYNIIIESSPDPDQNQLTVFLSYDNEIINLSYTFHLEKSSVEQNNSNKILIERIEKLEKTLDELEKTLEENNKITIGKIHNIETYNHNLSSLTSQYIKYSKNTEHIEIILPENTHDISRDKRNNYELKFNYDIDPNEVYTNLKKITISHWEYLFYFFNYCSYKFDQTNTVNTKIYMLYMSNNTIEEIIFGKKYCDFHRVIGGPFGSQYAGRVFSDTAKDIIVKQKYISKTVSIDSINNGKELCEHQVEIDMPKLQKIIAIDISYANTLLGLVEFIIKLKSNNKSKNLKKIIINKLTINSSCKSIPSYLKELRDLCEKYSIELDIHEIINK